MTDRGSSWILCFKFIRYQWTSYWIITTFPFRYLYVNRSYESLYLPRNPLENNSKFGKITALSDSALLVYVCECFRISNDQRQVFCTVAQKGQTQTKQKTQIKKAKRKQKSKTQRKKYKTNQKAQHKQKSKTQTKKTDWDKVNMKTR